MHKRAATSMDHHNVLPSIQAKKPEEENFLGFVNENINHLQSLNAEEYHRRVVAFDLRREFNKYVFQKKFDAHSDQISFREF